jgi:hypothetical protein
MQRQLNRSPPIHTAMQELVNDSGEASAGIIATTGQNQIEFRAENSGERRIRSGQPGWRRLWQGNGRR